MMLKRCIARSKPLTWLRLSPFVCWVVPISVRQAGGGPTKRRGKYRGQFEFVDKVRIVANGGKGGNGCISLEGYELHRLMSTEQLRGEDVGLVGRLQVVLDFRKPYEDTLCTLGGESATKKRPSGGTGGAGGNVYAIADNSLETLDSKLHHFNGQPGAPGGASGRKGRTGKNTYVRVPCGTLVFEVTAKEQAYGGFHPWSLAEGIECGGGKGEAAHESWERDEAGGVEEWGFGSDKSDEGEGEGGTEDHREYGHRNDEYEGQEDGEKGEMRSVADLEKHGERVLLASGGKPGLGNLNMASRRVGTKLPGQRGESRHYQFELRTIADVGLVGYPNAGKSTLLGCITAAKPKVAMYPFTTLTPVVGHVEYSDAFRLRVADIPGLIDGAHRNRGLGHEFLRHIARTRALMFVVDVAGSEGRDPVRDFVSLKEELRLYDGELARKPAFVVANKTDLPESGGYLEKLRRAADPFPVVPISALESRGLLDVVVTMRDVLQTGGHDHDSAAIGTTSTHVHTGQGDGGDADVTVEAAREQATRVSGLRVGGQGRETVQ